jgi:hypothetical protein
VVFGAVLGGFFMVHGRSLGTASRIWADPAPVLGSWSVVRMQAYDRITRAPIPVREWTLEVADATGTRPVRYITGPTHGPAASQRVAVWSVGETEGPVRLRWSLAAGDAEPGWREAEPVQPVRMPLAARGDARASGGANRQQPGIFPAWSADGCGDVISLTHPAGAPGRMGSETLWLRWTDSEGAPRPQATLDVSVDGAAGQRVRTDATGVARLQVSLPDEGVIRVRFPCDESAEAALERAWMVTPSWLRDDWRLPEVDGAGTAVHMSSDGPLPDGAWTALQCGAHWMAAAWTGPRETGMVTLEPGPWVSAGSSPPVLCWAHTFPWWSEDPPRRSVALVLPSTAGPAAWTAWFDRVDARYRPQVQRLPEEAPGPGERAILRWLPGLVRPSFQPPPVWATDQEVVEATLRSRRDEVLGRLRIVLGVLGMGVLAWIAWVLVPHIHARRRRWRALVSDAVLDSDMEEEGVSPVGELSSWWDVAAVLLICGLMLVGLGVLVVLMR